MLESIFPIFIATWLLISKEISENSSVILAIANVLSIQTPFCAAMLSAKYSASAVNAATAYIFFDFYEMESPKTKSTKTYPDAVYWFVLNIARKGLQYSTYTRPALRSSKLVSWLEYILGTEILFSHKSNTPQLAFSQIIINDLLQSQYLF